MTALELLTRQQDVTRALLRGDDVTPEDLALLACPAPRVAVGTEDGPALRALRDSAEELQVELARRMGALRQNRGARADQGGAGARYLDARG